MKIPGMFLQASRRNGVSLTFNNFRSPAFTVRTVLVEGRITPRLGLYGLSKTSTPMEAHCYSEMEGSIMASERSQGYFGCRLGNGVREVFNFDSRNPVR